MKATDESVVLVPPWLLRSVILADGQASGGVTLLLPRGRSHGVDRERLARIAEQKELPLSLGQIHGDVVLLLAQPDEEWLTSEPEPIALREYWRLLCHARVYITVKQRIAGGGAVDVATRVDRVGASAFNDARFVLQRDRLVLPTADDGEIYAQFAAQFVDLRFFAPHLLRRFFAAADHPEQILEAIRADVDVDAWVRRTRPAGAADPSDADDAATESAGPSVVLGEERLPVPAWLARMERRIARAARAGDDVRAAILQQRVGGGRLQGACGGLTNPHFARFVARLGKALRLDDQAAARSYTLLASVLARAEDRWRNVEGRLLYDLQKVCTESEREVFALDGLGWLFTLGRRPLRRAVPAQRRALVAKQLRAARSRLGRCHISPSQRRDLEVLLRQAVQRCENDLREQLRPAVGQALEQSGLQPGHTVERVAREKVIEEFLDGIVRRGFARMGDLRDTLSRNQLKLHDLTGPSALFWGDQLLQVDRRLRGPLDGVYHAGEAYLRLFQRLSSLLFATPAGRVFTYYALIPFGGAFIILEVLTRTIGKLFSKLAGVPVSFDPFDRPGSQLLLSLTGLFLLGIVNIAPFRRTVLRLTTGLIKAVHWVLVDWPGWLLCRRFVAAVVGTRAWRICVRYGIKPLVVTGLAWRLFLRNSASDVGVPLLLGVYGISAVALNSRVFRVVTHMLAHFTVVLWARLVTDLFTGLFRVVMRVFRVLLDRLERTLYSVDEWFRFRGGQGRLALVTKVALGSVWGIIAYCLRFFVNLLAEPQINPIKHFPVVTVSHKIILPTVPLMVAGLESLGLKSVQAKTFATTIAFLTPGIFGFLAWELRENWKLYGANRARTLRPVRMGSRGETLAQLLRPGFHSGTVPRIFARLRHAAQHETAGRSQALLHKHERALDGVAESVRLFLDRELAGLLNRHPGWSSTPVSIGAVDLAATRIRVTLECPSRGPAARVAFEQQDGWILAGIDEPGWMMGSSPSEAAMLGLALLGLYQMAGVDLVREQVEALFAPLPIRWQIRGTTLVIRTGLRLAAEVRYSLKEDDASSESAAQETDVLLPARAVPDLLLRRKGLTWRDWTRLWDGPASEWDAQLVAVARASVSVLPARAESSAVS
jgi:hypothetical protein